MKHKALMNLSGNFSEGKRLFGLKEESEQVTIMVHGVVGDLYDGMDSKSLVDSIRKASGKQIILDINTPGGLVFDAISIYTVLSEHVGGVRADITGAAESSGTILAAAADKIRIAQAGRYMVHQAWTIAMGNKSELSSIAEDLDAVDGAIADLLAERSGLAVNEVADLMAGENGKDGTTFTGIEAVNIGFVDELIPNKKRPKNLSANRRFAAEIELSRLKAA